MITKASEEYPEIEWENMATIDIDTDERMLVYLAIGTDKEGNTYEGTAYYYCGIFEKMEAIERISKSKK